LGPADLKKILQDLQHSKDPRVIVGPGDDAGVCLLDNIAIIETVDVITPLVDDPYTFGAISAANSMSDIYAMGGTPVTALAILGFSSCDYGHGVIKSLLKGATDKLREAGATLIGGHSIEDREFKFGLSVIGMVDKNKILKVSGAKLGDALILTKPLGIGILASALKRRVIKDKDKEMREAVSLMLTLNDRASRAAAHAGAHAVTDVTGFGLIGHALNMVEGSNPRLKTSGTGIDFVISYKKVPVITGVRELVSSGIAPGGAHNNLKFYGKKAIFSKGISKEERLILSDPQTSGGLLIALPEKGIDRFKEFAEKEKMLDFKIGEVIKGKGRIIIED